MGRHSQGHRGRVTRSVLNVAVLQERGARMKFIPTYKIHTRIMRPNSRMKLTACGPLAPGLRPRSHAAAYVGR